MEDLAMTTLAKTSDNLFPSFFNRFFEGGDLTDWNARNFAGSESTLPAVNVKEDENAYYLEVASPGMNKENFNVSYENGRLVIGAERKEEQNEKDAYTRREFCYQSFQRSFSVSEQAVESDKIAANYENGILKVTLPKREEVKPKPAKKIAIK
jgi:HSP20 family protein